MDLAFTSPKCSHRRVVLRVWFAHHPFFTGYFSLPFHPIDYDIFSSCLIWCISGWGCVCIQRYGNQSQGDQDHAEHIRLPEQRHRQRQCSRHTTQFIGSLARMVLSGHPLTGWIYGFGESDHCELCSWLLCGCYVLWRLAYRLAGWLAGFVDMWWRLPRQRGL